MQNLKINLMHWIAMKANEQIQSYGTEHIKLEKPGALFAHSGEIKTLIGYGTEFKVTSDADAYSANVAYWYYDRPNPSVSPAGDIFTDESNRRSISGAEAAVTLALRRLLKKEREMDALAASQTAQLKQERGQLPPDPEPEPEPDPEPDTTDTGNEDPAGQS